MSPARGIRVSAALGLFAALAAGVQVLAGGAGAAKAGRGGHADGLVGVVELQRRLLTSVYA